ncbi:MAG: peptide chain release factor N(5)-glutamine methyltransferase [Candidatus Nomurabacteria bacterium]|jgi:release factor glutamine methyltransferase|nr:peptide chain release factor N(5)-glutamine methyltransferase [Candidatus Nomurabacteria bacterium]
MTAETWLKSATLKLQIAGIPSAKLDAELILAHTANLPRESLHAHLDRHLPSSAVTTANKLLSRREQREPLAYLTGHKEFYGRDFIVNRDVLIPRPESEEIIDIAKILAPTQATIVDVGTGSGCLGVTLKLELPSAQVTLSDISERALKVARRNAKNLAAAVKVQKSDLLKNLPQPVDIIVANLPYLDKSWSVSPETRHEPPAALFASQSGEQPNRALLSAAPAHLKKQGRLILEADPKSHASLIDFAKSQTPLRLLQKTNFILVFNL